MLFETETLSVLYVTKSIDSEALLIGMAMNIRNNLAGVVTRRLSFPQAGQFLAPGNINDRQHLQVF